MKKRIFITLLSAVLAANMSACRYIPQNNYESKTNTMSFDTKDTLSSPLENESNNGLPNQNETVRDVPELGQLKLLSHPHLTKASTWWSYEKEEYYIYINEWDTYRPLMVGVSSYRIWGGFTDNSTIIDNETATFATIYQAGKHDEPIILTYHFNRNNTLVELHAVPLNIVASSEYDTYFVIMHDTNHGYYFLTPRMDGDQDWRIDRFPGWHMDGILGWPLFIFETTDGGKSWNQISTNTFPPHISDYINIVKFISPNIGIISFRYEGFEDLCERTYLTLDGGLTWHQISQLSYPFDLKKTHTWYSEVSDIDQLDDHYYLTVEVRGTLVAVENSDYSFPSEYTIVEFRFESKDLINWSLIED